MTQPEEGRSALRPLTPGDERHGKVSTYTNHVCRCQLCRAAWALYMKTLRERKAALAAELAGESGAA